MKSGKNYFVYYNGDVITINEHSYTIITVHKVNAKIRVMGESDHACLDEFLYQAIFIPKGGLSRLKIKLMLLEYTFIEKVWEKISDLGVIAKQSDEDVGSARTRIIHAYGYIDENTPELAISFFGV